MTLYVYIYKLALPERYKNYSILLYY